MEAVQSTLLPCDHCGDTVAMLILPDNIYSSLDFEHYVSTMRHKYVSYDVPTWIIATMFEDKGEDFPVDILKIWPEREIIFSQSARDFNIMLDEIISSHCAAS